ncbi:MAG: hypothetical protein MK033_12245 [Candidatus Caenarcaniphilales bacterium]|nr:hypothetical protein [Candidatus Caenarcaniphilales bacterium]
MGLQNLLKNKNAQGLKNKPKINDSNYLYLRAKGKDIRQAAPELIQKKSNNY